MTEAATTMTTIRSVARMLSIPFLFLTSFRNIVSLVLLEIGRQQSLSVGIIKCFFRNLPQSNRVTRLCDPALQTGGVSSTQEGNRQHPRYAPNGRHSRGRLSHGIRLRHRTIHRPDPATEPSEGSAKPRVLQFRTKQSDLQRDTILEKHWKHPDHLGKLLCEEFKFQPVRKGHLDRPALNNPDDTGTGPASDIFSMQLHQYRKRVHVLDRKLLHNNPVILSRQHVLLLCSKILLIRARLSSHKTQPDCGPQALPG